MTANQEEQIVETLVDTLGLERLTQILGPERLAKLQDPQITFQTLESQTLIEQMKKVYNIELTPELIAQL